MESVKFSVLQLNAWLMALPFFTYSEDYAERRRHLPAALAATGADILCLQEVWRNRDKFELERELRKLGYGYFFYSRHLFGVGDGNFLASKFPVTRTEVAAPFRAFTQPIELWGRKRMLAGTIEIPGGGPVDFYLTHLGSVLFDTKKRMHDARSRQKLLLQLIEVSSIIRKHRRSEFAILTGDLNFHYQANDGKGGFHPVYAEEYSQFMLALEAHDLRFENTFLTANQMDATHPAVATFSQANAYAKKGFENYPEETLDYVLHTPHPRFSVNESRIVFREPLTEKIPALSDHFGIFSTFTIQRT